MTYTEAAGVFRRMEQCGDMATEECAVPGKCMGCGLHVSAEEEDAAFRLAVAALERMAEIEDDGK